MGRRERGPAPSGRLRAGRIVARAAAAAALALVAAPMVMGAGEPEWSGAPWFALALLALLVVRVVAVGAGCGRRALGRPRDLAVAVAWLAYVAAVHCGDPGTSADNLPTRELPARLLAGKGLDFSDQAREPGHEPYWLVRTPSGLLPAFPLGTALLHLPYVAVASQIHEPASATRLTERWEKHSAALLSATAVGLLAWALRRRFPARVAAGAALAFGLASPQISTSAQGLWSHTGEILLLSATLALLAARGRAWRGVPAGLAFAGAFACRPHALLALPALAAFGHRRGARQWPALSAAAIGVAVVLAAQWSVFGHGLGGYGLLNERDGGFSAGGLGEGLLGGLFSPSRGLVLFVPWTLFVLAAPRFARRPLEERLVLGGSVSALAYLGAAAAYVKWWGGYSLGPRLAVEATLFLALVSVPLWKAGIPRALHSGLVLAVAVSALVQLGLLHSSAARDWNELADVDHHPDRLWSLRHGQLAAALVPGWRFEAAPYRHLRLEPPGRRGVHLPLDLSGVANARYDLDPFRPASPGRFPRFAQLDPAELNGEGRLFRFLPRGEPNAWTIEGPSAARVAAPGMPADALFAVLAASGASERTRGERIGALRVSFADGMALEFPLRLDHDLYEYRAELRGDWPPVERVYAGRGFEPDAIVWQRFAFGRARREVREVEVRVERPGASVVVLAATLARDPPRLPPAKRSPPASVP